MAFQRKRSGGGSAAYSVALSCKVGKGYEKGPSFSFWPNEQGGPAFTGTLKDDRLAQVLEFLSNAHEANLPVRLAMFDQLEQQGGSFKKQGGFKKAGGSPGFAQRKPNPFKRHQREEQEEGDGPEFGEE